MKRPSSLFVAALLVVLLCVPARATAQGPPQFAAIDGKVVDAEEKPVANALVLVSSRLGGQPRPAKTDAKGAYSVPYLMAGQYRLTVMGAGFAEATADVVLVENETAHFDFKLVPGTTRPGLSHVDTKAPAHPVDEATGHVHVTSEEDIRHKRPSTTAEALGDSPALQHTGANPIQQTPAVGGLPGPRTGVSVDGERLTNQRAGVSTSLIAPADLEAGEVTVGGASNVHGSGALGGTVALTTKSAPRVESGHLLGLELNGGYSTNGDWRDGGVALLYSNSKLAARLSGTLFRQGSYDAGGTGIDRREVIAIGELVARVGVSPSTYPVFDFPAGGEVLNAQAHGSYDAIDVRFYPGPKHTLRYNQLNSHHYDIGSPFEAPPYNSVTQWSDFQRFDKYSMRYQGTGLLPWLPQFSVSAYGQRITYPTNGLYHIAVPGSSWAPQPAPQPPVFTGNTSTFVPGRYTENTIRTTDVGLAVDASVSPFRKELGLTLAAGYSLLHEESDDEFHEIIFNPAYPASAPDALDVDYINNAVYVNATYQRLKRVHATAGVRYDRWTSEAEVPPGATAPAARFRTDRGYFSPHAGLSFPLAFGLTPFVNWAFSFREPSASEQYPARVFAAPAPASRQGKAAADPNLLLRLEPERANTVAAGAIFNHKFGTRSVFAMVEVFRNRVENYNIAFGESPVPTFSSGASRGAVRREAAQIAPLPELPLNDVVIVGVVANYQISLPIGRFGSISPSGSLYALRGRNDTPLPSFIPLVEALYNRNDLPIKLEGTVDDFPLGFMIPFDGTFGVTYAAPRGRWTLGYELRHSSRVTRVDPVTFFLGPQVSYATFASLAPFTVQNLRGGYTFTRESNRLMLTASIDNLTNELFYEHYQYAPAPGRSLRLGVSMDLSNLLER